MIADCEFRNKEPEFRIRNPGEKQLKWSFSKLLDSGFWLLDSMNWPWAMRLGPVGILYYPLNKPDNLLT